MNDGANARHWSEYIRTRVMRDVSIYAGSARARVLPVFDALSREASKVADDDFERVYKQLTGDNYEEAEAAAAQSVERGLEFYETVVSVRWAVLSLFTSGLFHLFEQHVAVLYAEAVLKNRTASNLRLQKVAERFKTTLHIDVSEFPTWAKVLELQLVASAVRDADGVAAKKLRAIRADLFTYPAWRERGVRWQKRRFDRFLLGEGVYVTPPEFDQYVGAVMGFWSALASRIDALGATSDLARPDTGAG
jgi:hypothetical protein